MEYYNRRKFITGATSTAAALGLAGCSGVFGTGSDDPDRQDWMDEDMSLVTAQEHPKLREPNEWEKNNSETINHFVFSAYEADNVQQPFRNQFNADTNLELFTSMPKILNRMRAGEWENFHQATLDMGFMPKFAEEGFIRPLDFDSWKPYTFDNYIDLMQPENYEFAFLDENSWEFSKDGQLYGIPQRWGWVSMVVNTEEVDEEDWHKYDAAWRGDKYNVGINDAQWAWTVKNVMLRLGIDPWREHTDDEVQQIKDELFALFEGAKTLLPGWGPSLQAMKSGEIDVLIYAFNALASSLRRDTGEHDKFKAPVPSEPVNGQKQGMIWVESTYMLKGPHPSVSDNYVAYLQKPEIAAELMWPDTGIIGAVPQKAAVDELSKEQRSTMDYEYWSEATDNSQFFRGTPDIDKFESIYREAKTRVGKSS